VDIYLDTALSSNDTRFDWSSAISTPTGGHRRDFIFNAGFYNDLSGDDGFVISAGNNAGRSDSYPKNPGHDPFVITTSGWYTFEHHFRNNAGVLAVDLGIYDSAGSSLKTWTLSNPNDLIDVTVGGNRYGWFANNELDVLAFDNTQLIAGPFQASSAAIPEPATMGLLTMGLGGLAAGAWRRRRRRK
jgi:hypothetical protein